MLENVEKQKESMKSVEELFGKCKKKSTHNVQSNDLLDQMLQLFLKNCVTHIPIQLSTLGFLLCLGRHVSFLLKGKKN